MTEFSNDFFLETGIVIKQEPEMPDMTTITTSASVPIPPRKYHIFDLREFGVEIPTSYQDVNVTSSILTPTDNSTNSSVWTTRCDELDCDFTKSGPLIHMDDDDIFQVDKADLIQGPTLAELNANDETLLEDLNFDDLLLPDQGTLNYLDVSQAGNKISPVIQVLHNNSHNVHNTASTYMHPGMGYMRSLDSTPSASPSPYGTSNFRVLTPAFSPTSQTSSTSSLLQSISSTSLPPSGFSLHQRHSALHDLLMKRERNMASPDSGILLGQSVPTRSVHQIGSSAGVKPYHSPSSRLSSSAPTHLGMDQIWQRREPRKHLLSTSSLVEAGSTSSLSTGGILSPEGLDLSNEDDIESEEDSDHYEDYSSDGDSDNENDKSYQLSGSKRERYFWQYNVQAKGPKGQRLFMKTKMEDPYILNEITDPVFSPTCSVRGIKHSGKARKGDGNDLSPNPRKLCNIGRELDKLGRVINNMTPVSELPFNVRPKSRKEKNKLASRACRLKKKAQHEANKIKLHGLEQEHKRLMNAIAQSKKLLLLKVREASPDNQEEISNHLEKIIKVVTKSLIAGNSTEYVNRIIDKVKSTGSIRSLQEL